MQKLRQSKVFHFWNDREKWIAKRKTYCGTESIDFIIILKLPFRLDRANFHVYVPTYPFLLLYQCSSPSQSLCIPYAFSGVFIWTSLHLAFRDWDFFFPDFFGHISNSIHRLFCSGMYVTNTYIHHTYDILA